MSGTTDFELAVIIPASNEEKYIGRCLSALADQVDAPKMLIVVYCNACTDNTFGLAGAFTDKFAALGHKLECIETSEGGKIRALNAAERIVQSICAAAPRAYLDADVVCDQTLMAETTRALRQNEATYATGTMQVMKASSFFTTAYADFWQQLPFFSGGATGAGFFAVNSIARARWVAFPDIISDDTFVRLQFAPHERSEVSASYQWPMAEGYWNLVKVRRRQDTGVQEVTQKFPHLAKNEQRPQVTIPVLVGLLFRKPIGFLAYLLVYVSTKYAPKDTNWTRVR